MNLIELKNQPKRYYSDHNTVYSCQYHVIFTTKYRRKVLSDIMVEEIKRLIFDKQTEYNYHILEMEVMPDHVHLLIEIHPKDSVRKVISKIKRFLSHELRAKHPELNRKLPTLWTRAMFVSTVGSVSLETVKKYIELQKGK